MFRLQKSDTRLMVITFYERRIDIGTSSDLTLHTSGTDQHTLRVNPQSLIKMKCTCINLLTNKTSHRELVRN